MITDPGDPPPFECDNWALKSRVLLVCDHGGCAVPSRLAQLGLRSVTLRQHIGWDIGAATVSRALSKLMAAPAIIANYSRLVIDLNRYPNEPESIVEVSDGVIIPRNVNLADSERAARRRVFFDPYHQRIDAWLAHAEDEGSVPALVSIHSFTPSIGDVVRPWDIGILWDHDGRIPVPFMELMAAAGAKVGDNCPYSGRDPAGYYTVRHHAARRGIPHIVIEIRQDLIENKAGVLAWADRITSVLKTVIGLEPTFAPLPFDARPTHPLPEG